MEKYFGDIFGYLRLKAAVLCWLIRRKVGIFAKEMTSTSFVKESIFSLFAEKTNTGK